ncbi:MAG: response regulator [Elusimicrobiota bacterium]
MARSAEVLIVDDDPGVSAVFKTFLTRKGHRVTLAASAEEGLRLAAGKRFDAVLLDNGLPGRMGLSALPEFAKQAGSVIMVTGLPSEDAATDAGLLGAKGFLTKPVDFAQLESLIEQSLA